MKTKFYFKKVKTKLNLFLKYLYDSNGYIERYVTNKTLIL